nr:helix-turn-helix domain-containing protein [uncultured Roseococcus sp.]
METNSAPLRPVVFSTEGLPAKEQFGVWHDTNAPMLGVAGDEQACASFRARREIWSFGPFALSRVQASASRYWRTGMDVRRDSLDHWMVTIARRGSRHFRMANGECLLMPPNVTSTMSLNESFEGEREEIDWLGLVIPRHVLPQAGAAMDASRQKPLETALGRLLGAYLRNLKAQLPLLGTADIPRLVEATRVMILACATGTPDAIAEAAGQIDAVRRAQVMTLIRQQIGSPMLTPAGLCQMLRISRSQLYRLFEAEGGISHMIHVERLAHVHRALRDPAERRGIGQIAAEAGFVEHSTFSRAFRRAYGASPSDLRMAMLSTAPDIGARPAAFSIEPRNLGEALRRL